MTTGDSLRQLKREFTDDVARSRSGDALVEEWLGTGEPPPMTLAAFAAKKIDALKAERDAWEKESAGWEQQLIATEKQYAVVTAFVDSLKRQLAVRDDRNSEE